jgi:hypothetical protein
MAGKEKSETNIMVRFPQHLEVEEAECPKEASRLVTAVGRVWCQSYGSFCRGFSADIARPRVGKT